MTLIQNDIVSVDLNLEINRFGLGFWIDIKYGFEINIACFSLHVCFEKMQNEQIDTLIEILEKEKNK